MNRKRGSAVLVLAVGCCVVLAAGLGESAPLRSAADTFVVHEWGTFSTFSGSNGALCRFAPDDRGLPSFVHSHWQYIKGGPSEVLVSLETPVLYFYSDRERSVSVRVDFPEGQMTQWYPHTSRILLPHTLLWEDLRILAPGQKVELARKEASRYYAARQTDACIVQARDAGDKVESERLIFYRGVGSFRMPLEVRAEGNGRFRVKNAGRQALPGVVLVRVQDGKVRFAAHAPLAGRDEITLAEPREDSSADRLGEAVAELLVKQGLYEKEARAMVATWRSDWFEEEGTRVLYLVPPTLTDELLPLQITPRPDRLLRVLVGRHDVLTPERERQIDLLVNKLEEGSKKEAQTADTALSKLGRYRRAAQAAAVERRQAHRTAAQAVK